MNQSQWSSRLRRRSAAPHMLVLRVRSPPEARMSVSYQCCVLSLVQRSSTDCVVTVCDLETSRMRP